jgi:dihydroorotase
MSGLLIKNAVIVDHPEADLTKKSNLLVEDGFIKSISEDIGDDETVETVDIEGDFLSRGFIDMHTHITVPGLTQYKGYEFGVDILKYGVNSGVSTMVDAGTFGAETVQPAIDYVKDKDTTVYFLINAAKTGLVPLKPELEDMNNIDIDAAKKTYELYKTHIVGIKARASKSASGKSGIEAIIKAKELAVALELPIVVHIGHAPPKIEDVLAILSEGDIITHCFHGKLSNAIVDQNYKPKNETLMARERGVLFDIGHGSESFNYKVAKSLYESGFLPDIISTDLHAQNEHGPVHSLPATIYKFITLNDSILPWITMVTSKPGKAFHLTESSKLSAGEKADLTIFNTVPTKEEYLDSDGNPIQITKKLYVKMLIKGTKRIMINK